jgi:hypothetical protein
VKIRFSVAVLSIGMGILGCGPTQTIIITATTLPPNSTVEVAITSLPAISATSTEELLIVPTATTAPTTEPETLDEIPPGWLTIHTPVPGLETVSHPPEYEVLPGVRLSVDGVRLDDPQVLTIHNPAAEGGFVMTIQNIIPDPRTPTMEEQVQQDESCAALVTPEPILFAPWLSDTLIYKNTPCGAYGSTLIYAYDHHTGYTYFRVSVESRVPYDTIATEVEAVLRTFRFYENPNNPR